MPSLKTLANRPVHGAGEDVLIIVVHPKDEAAVDHSVEMSRRLIALQRRRLVESEVLDRRARQTLHDDVLPRLHAALLTLSAGTSPAGSSRAEVVSLLTEVHRRLAGLLQDMPSRPIPEVARWGLIGALRQVVENEMAGAFEGVRWQIGPAAEQVAGNLPGLAAEVLFSAAQVTDPIGALRLLHGCLLTRSIARVVK